MALKKPPRSRERTKAETREALIRAGTDLFASEGLDVSLDAICERAGYTRGAFYVHFRDRDDLMVAVMDRVGVAFLDTVLMTGAGDLRAVVQRFLGAVASGGYPLMKKGGVRPHQLLDACARSPVIRRRYVALVADSIGRLTEVIVHSQDANTVRDDVPARDVAAIALAAIIGAQTMMELRVSPEAPLIDPLRAGATMLTLLAAKAPRRRGA
jgi:AcrR family transcriptional regulator